MLCASPRFCVLSTRLLAKRHFSASPRLLAQPSSVDENDALPDIATWRRAALHAEHQGTPIVFRQQVREDDSRDAAPPLLLPALRKWFSPQAPGKSTELSPALAQHLHHIVPYELAPSSSEPSKKHSIQHFIDWLQTSPDSTYPNLAALLKDRITASRLEQQAHLPPSQQNQEPFSTPFIRFDAPLALLNAALHFNKQPPNPPSSSSNPISQLYIAQLPLSDLPPSLQPDVPTPCPLTAPPTPATPYTADIYTSSLWLGLEPTFTPWHRDPNPNLFCQLVGCKTVRLMPPAQGKQLFARVNAGLGRPSGSYAIRGHEMMQAVERKAWWDAVWGAGVPGGMFEVVLRPRDVLFLPLGWWHSVRSVGGGSGRLNASVNWWFRWRKVALPEGK